ncbi:MAG: alpha/beta hydrolase [Flavobacteriales bacterium]|nr:alpha/beta hydrolase [Flavobacteriales bacterium]
MQDHTAKGTKGAKTEAHATEGAPLRSLRPLRYSTSNKLAVQYFTHGPTLAYRTYGHGPLPMLAFHGFGRTGADFAVLEQALGDRCTLYAFDLHFHGQSPGYPERADEPFTPKELAIYFTAFADQLNAPKVLLLGYSLGGRIALSLLEQVPERIERVLLAAPDGLKTRPWYRGLATSKLGRVLYRRFVVKPTITHAIIKTLRAVRVMNERMHRFLMGQTDSRAKRQLVHDVWLSYRLIEPDLAYVAANAVAHTVPVHLFFGTHDRVIRPASGENLRKYAPKAIGQEELPFGHALLTAELGTAIRSHLG